MVEISQKQLDFYRHRTFHLLPQNRVVSFQQAVSFVNERGFVHFWPIKGMLFPSLWAAVAGNRPVANNHDDPGHITWNWKDSSLGGRDWYYAKVFRKKGTMISFDAVPYFYALSENYGAYEEDYLTLYEQGRISLDAKQIYELILKQGPLDTIELRQAARMKGPGKDSRFARALVDLQSGFYILPIGVRPTGAWHYAYAYDLTARHYPDLVERARHISEETARQEIIRLFGLSLGIFDARHLQKYFSWSLIDIQHALDKLVDDCVLIYLDRLLSISGDWYVHPEIQYR